MTSDLELNVRYGPSNGTNFVHSHLIHLLGLCEDKDTLFVAMEENVHSLKQVLLDSRALIHYPVYATKNQRFSTLNEVDVFRYLIGVANGMEYLSMNNVSLQSIDLVDRT